MNDNPTPPREDGDDVASLLRLAGKRDAVPPERAARIRTAARAQWKEGVRRRTHRRYLYGAAGLAAAASLVLAVSLWMLPSDNGVSTTTDASMRVEAITGPAWGLVAPGTVDGFRVELEPGTEIQPGMELVTAEDGRAAIRLASGHSVRLDRSTTIRLIDGRTLALDGGALYVDSGSGTPTEHPIEIRTPLGVVRETGTQYEVRLAGDAVRLRLREGTAVLQYDGQAQEVRAGAELRLGADGVPTRQVIPTHGPEWGWIAGITPVPDLEGLTAQAFLDWIAREKGLRLAFADESTARAAGETVLGGTIEVLSPDEALDAVLPTCRMRHRVAEDVLVISAGME